MAIEDAPVVRLIAFDEAEAYNPDRPISSLIRTQLLHLHLAENLALPAALRTNININRLLTERQASEYIHQVTTLLHQQGESVSKASVPLKKKAAPKKKAPARKALPAKKTKVTAKAAKAKPKVRTTAKKKVGKQPKSR
jgi:hypothetical protein